MGCHTWFYRPLNKGEKMSRKFENNYQIFCPPKKETCVVCTCKDTPHDLFRFNAYSPDIHLWSLEETMEFIKNNKNNMTFCGGWEDRVRAFWLEHPNGVIQID